MPLNCAPNEGEELDYQELYNPATQSSSLFTSVAKVEAALQLALENREKIQAAKDMENKLDPQLLEKFKKYYDLMDTARPNSLIATPFIFDLANPKTVSRAIGERSPSPTGKGVSAKVGIEAAKNGKGIHDLFAAAVNPDEKFKGIILIIKEM